MPRNGGSDDRNGRNLDQVGVVATVAAAAAVGALVVGAVSALGNFFAEEPQMETSSSTRRDSSSRRMAGSSSSSRSGYRCEEKDEDSAKPDVLELWLQKEAVAMVKDRSWATPAESEGLTCKICFDRRISYVLECGHTLCRQCAVNIVEHHARLCPFDRTKVTKPPQKLFV